MCQHLEAMVLKNPTHEQQTLGYLLRHAFDQMVAEVYGSLAATGFADLRPAHGAVFRHILPGGSRITELAHLASVTKQSMAYLVDDLAALGYVEQNADPRDGRAKVVTLTDRGQTAQNAILSASRRYEATLANKVGPDAYHQMRSTLEKLTI